MGDKAQRIMGALDSSESTYKLWLDYSAKYEDVKVDEVSFFLKGIIVANKYLLEQLSKENK